MNELSLFTGGGGGLLGSILLGWRPIGYVEIEPYCQEVLSKRITEGFLPEAPIFTDIKSFSRLYARRYKGLVDIVTAGFPCQPWTVAGQRKSATDKRNLWPDTIRVIRKIQPSWILLENVPGLLAESYGYFGQILKDLAEAGYDAQWQVLGASDIGAPHRRKRVWIVAIANGPGFPDIQGQLSDAKPPGGTFPFTNGQKPESQNGRWWAIEPGMGRVAHGVANRVGRIRALGNGQVPAVVKSVWEMMLHKEIRVAETG